MIQQTMEEIFNQFSIYGDFVSCRAFGTGHINNTYVSVWNQAGTQVRYTHQRINKNVFKNPAELMQNIHNVTGHIAAKLRAECKTSGFAPDALFPSRRTLSLVPAKDGRLFYTDKDGEYWRTYFFIENAGTYEVMDGPALAQKAGQAAGLFQSQLADYKGQRLFDTIPRFHNMFWRYEQLEQALSSDLKKRAKDVNFEIDFLLKNRERGMTLSEGLKSGKLRESIAHNDTKLNNILFDNTSGDAICMIDLDTVMSGTPLFDTGDLIRTATITAEEDQQDLSKISFNIEVFKPLVSGYLSAAGSFLTNYEKSLIAESGRIFAQIMAVRFLTDYLNGDVYYKIDRPSHNIDRTRTQIKLMQSMDSQWESIQNFMEVAR